MEYSTGEVAPRPFSEVGGLDASVEDAELVESEYGDLPLDSRVARLADSGSAWLSGTAEGDRLLAWKRGELRSALVLDSDLALCDDDVGDARALEGGPAAAAAVAMLLRELSIAGEIRACALTVQLKKHLSRHGECAPERR